MHAHQFIKMDECEVETPTIDLAAYSSRQKSVVWKYFGIEKNSSGVAERDRRVTCKICAQKVAHGGGTTNLKNHLKTNHRAEFEELYGSEQVANQTSMDRFVQSSPSSSIKKLPHNSTRAVELSNAVVEFVVRDLRPVSVVDGYGFLNLMETAEPRYTVPCRRTIMNLIDRKYSDLKRSVRGSLSGQQCVTLTTDMWTSRAGEGYFSLTAHYITEEFEMCSSHLQCHHLPGVHDHTHISDAISDALADWCIQLDTDVVAFVTDNGSNIKKSLKDDLNKLNLPCAGHTLNLSVQRAFLLPEVRTAVSRAKKVVEHFNRSRLHLEELEEKQRLLGLPLHKLIQGVQHRWNSVYDMIERLCEQQAAVAAVLHNHRDLLHLEHSPAEWRLLEDLCKVLEPFKDATTYLSASKYPTLSVLGPVLHKILKTLEEDGSSAISAVNRTISNDLQTRYQENEIRMLLNKASLLDPRLKSLVHLDEEEQTSTIDSLVNEIVAKFSPVVDEEMVILDDSPNSHQTTANETTQTSDSNGGPVRKKCMLEKLLGTSFSDNGDSSVTVSHNELVMAELSRYKSEAVLELNGKPLEWWNKYKHSFPNLSLMARKYLGVVATSVPSERLFSCAGNIVTSKRSALEPENVEKLVFLHDNLPSFKNLPYQRATQ